MRCEPSITNLNRLETSLRQSSTVIRATVYSPLGQGNTSLKRFRQASRSADGKIPNATPSVSLRDTLLLQKLALPHGVDLKAQVFYHTVGVCVGLTRCSQVTVDENGVGRIQAQRLQ